MQLSLSLHKMQTTLSDDNTALYYLEDVCLNDYLGQMIRIDYHHEIYCIACGRKTTKSFNQGYCFPCMRTLAECDSCIIKPELCHYAQGSCREPEWGQRHCLKDHYVYLANTGNVKVGITRLKNTPMRWIDQGASQALPILKVEQRLLSGLIEVALKSHISDKTNWRTMLKAPAPMLDLIAVKERLMPEIHEIIAELKTKYGADSVMAVDADVLDIAYPVLQYPTKIASLNLDKTPLVEGRLMGIKGQYLMLDCGVINIRKFAGYRCDLTLF
ncbi:MAG: DUF2797 domain-containing protein [Francisellaceae bacterium]